METEKQIQNQPRIRLLVNGSLAVIFIISIFLGAQSIQLYRFSLIPGKFLFDVGCIGAVIGYSILYFVPDGLYSKILGNIMAIAAGGSILVFGLLQINQSFSDHKVKVQTFRVIKSGTISSNRNPCIRHYAEINFNGLTKKLLFDCDDQNTVKTFSGIKLNYSKGFFGFEVIRSHELLN